MTQVTTTEQTATKAAKADRFVALSTDQAKAIATTARPAVTPCLCGCGGTTKGRFVPGHDATLKETLKATVKGGGAAAKHAQAALETFGWDTPAAS
jgi:hypothetical protein